MVKSTDVSKVGITLSLSFYHFTFPYINIYVKMSCISLELILVPDACHKLEDNWRRLSVGCKQLDSFLEGGIPVRGITEIAGESGSGKTQLCLQLALSVQYPQLLGGLEGGMSNLCLYRIKSWQLFFI